MGNFENIQKMKISALLIAAVAASPMGKPNASPGSPTAIQADSDTPVSGKPPKPDSGKPPKSGKPPRSGKPDSGKPPKTGKPHSGKPGSGKPPKPQSGHFDKEMEKEYDEFNKMWGMAKGKGGNTNAMNVNFAPVNTNMQNFININTEVETDVDVNSSKNGKDGKEGHSKPQSGKGNGRPESGSEHGRPGKPNYEKPEFDGQWKEAMMEKVYEKMTEFYPYLPVMKDIVEAITGMDCEEIKAKIEKLLFDGERFEVILMKIETGMITKTEIQWWMRSKSADIYQKMIEECPWMTMTEEEREEAEEEFKKWMKEQFGIDCERIKEGIKQYLQAAFDLKVDEIMEKIQEISDNVDKLGPQPIPDMGFDFDFDM